MLEDLIGDSTFDFCVDSGYYSSPIDSLIYLSWKDLFSPN